MARPRSRERFRTESSSKVPLRLISEAVEIVPVEETLPQEEVKTFNEHLKASGLPTHRLAELELIDPIVIPGFEDEDYILSGESNNFIANLAVYSGYEHGMRPIPVTRQDLEKMLTSDASLDQLKSARTGSSHIYKPAFWRSAIEDPNILDLAAKISASRAQNRANQEEKYTDEVLELGQLMRRRIDARDPGVINPDGSVDLRYLIV